MTTVMMMVVIMMMVASHGFQTTTCIYYPHIHKLSFLPEVRKGKEITKNYTEFVLILNLRPLAQKSSSPDQWYSTFLVSVPPDIISLQLCTPKVVGV
jgi:hypothetical protein